MSSIPSYILPQVQVFQDFTTVPAAAANALQAHISGPNGQLVRYAQADERANGLLGTYDYVDDAIYAWPNRVAGGVIDQTYVKLWVEKALLGYLTDTSTVSVASRRSVISDSVNFATNGAFLRDASLGDRDVQPGDTVKATFAGSGLVLWTSVAAVTASAVTSSIGTATADASNGQTAVNGATIRQTQGPFNAMTPSVSSSTAYDTYNPYPTGQITETYTIAVIQSSIHGDLTTARLRVISASGLDDVASVTPSYDGHYTAIGTLGFQVLFDATGTDASESADDSNISPNDFIAGQKWVATVTAGFTTTAPTANTGTNTGVYTGAQDTTYVVTVVQGGKFAGGTPKVQVSTTTGYDLSGPTPVTAAATYVGAGTKGLLIKFSGTGLALGDRFYVPAIAASTGNMRTIVFTNNIPATVTNDTACSLQLFIAKDVLQIPQNRAGDAPFTNFDMAATQITVHAGATAYDPSWTFDGVPVALPIYSDSGQDFGKLYVEYREWLPTLVGQVDGISDVSEIGSIPGQLDPDNPLAWAVFKAVSNSNGVPVLYTAVADPTVTADWVAVLDLISNRDDTYGLVPLTHDKTIKDLYQAHVNGESGATEGLWRVTHLTLESVPTVPVVSAGSSVTGYTSATTTDGAVALATVADDPDTTGTQYTLVTCTSVNADFITNGVIGGDILRISFSTDGFGNVTYQEFVVDTVLTEESLLLLAGPNSPISVATKIEVWRNLSADAEAAAIGKIAGAYADRRVRAVWPDTISDGGTVMDGYYVCAALAGLRSGVLPQQGLTNLAIAGFDDVSRTTKKFNASQLNQMAQSGVWIVTQNPSGTVYSRHALTTGSYADLNQREEMIIANVDSISYRFAQTFAPYIGVANVTPSTINLMMLDALSLIETLKTESATATLGGQLVDATVVSIAQSLTLLDQVVAFINLDLPAPFNSFEIHLII